MFFHYLTFLLFYNSAQPYRFSASMLKMNSIFRLQLDADKLVIAGLELARSIQTPFEYTCRSFLSIPGLFLKYEDFNLVRLDPQDILITKETNYRLPNILKSHSPTSQIEKFMFNTNYRLVTEVNSETHLLKQYFFSGRLLKRVEKKSLPS